MNHYSTGRTRGRAWRSRGAPSRQQPFVQEERLIPAPLGEERVTKSAAQINSATTSEEAEISDCHYVASYNMLEGLEQKSILVPGRPPVWTPLQGTTTLSPDSGIYYRDENSARFPDYPMEPAARSIYAMAPSFDSSEIDIFGCGSTLGDILRISLGTPKPFSFVVHMIGNTAFFLRRNNSPAETIEGNTGFGHAFPEAYTTWHKDVKGSASHQRIVGYSFGGLRFLVRSEADGYILDQVEDSDDDADEAGGVRLVDRSEDSTKASVQDLVDGFLKPTAPSVIQAEDSVVVRAQGHRVPQSSVVDVKTRSAWKPLDDIMAEQLPRLWVRQISQFILALHTKGRFDHPEVQDVTYKLLDWEKGSMTALRRMAALIAEIRDTVRTTSGGKLEVRGTEASTLQLRELSAAEMREWNALPGDLRERWARE